MRGVTLFSKLIAKLHEAKSSKISYHERLTSSFSLAYLRSIKNLHSGRRGFVIGNGPSLRISDLDKLTRDVTIASNKIYLAYDQTQWRPSYFTVIDSLVWSKISSSIHNYVSLPIVSADLFPASSRNSLLQPCVSVPSLGHAPFVDTQPAFSPDLAIGAYGGSSVTYFNLQLAVHLGLDPIYLIGCDHHYNEADSPEHSPIQSSSINHFHPDYRKPGEIVNPAPIENMTTSYNIARDFADLHDIKIANATRGGYLESFGRVDFESLF
jgi:hypothetical protein